MTNRQIAAIKTREKLLAAAKEIICTRGLTSTSVDEITERCGVSKGTFYTYFKHKEDIVFALSRGVFQEILEEAKNYGGTFLSKLKKYMTEFSGYIEKSSLKLCQEWIKNVTVPELVKDERDKEKLFCDIAAMAELLKGGKACGALKPETPEEELARMLTDILYGQMLCWCMSGGAYGFKDRTERFCELFLDSMLSKYLA